LPAGPFALFIAHKVGTDLSYVTLTRTLTSAGSDFITSGFEVGDTAILDHLDASTDPRFVEIESVSATEIVFAEDVGDEALIPDFSGIATTALHGATPNPVSGYAAECS